MIDIYLNTWIFYIYMNLVGWPQLYGIRYWSEVRVVVLEGSGKERLDPTKAK